MILLDKDERILVVEPEIGRLATRLFGVLPDTDGRYHVKLFGKIKPKKKVLLPELPAEISW